MPSEIIFVDVVVQHITAATACSTADTYRYDITETVISTEVIQFDDDGYGLVSVVTPEDAKRIVLKVSNIIKR